VKAVSETLQFAPAVRIGGQILISGIVGTDAQGLLPPDFRSQAKNVFATLEAILNEAGATLDDVASRDPTPSPQYPLLARDRPAIEYREAASAALDSERAATNGNLGGMILSTEPRERAGGVVRGRYDPNGHIH
jgi:hypothetical protein